MTAGTRTAPSELASGIADSLPLGFALVPIGLAFGYGADGVGLSWWLAGLMSAIVYAGPSQFIAIGMLATAASVPIIALTTFVANLRYTLFAASLAPYLRDAPRWRLALLPHTLADGSYAVTLDHVRRKPNRPRKDLYLLGSFLVSFGFWVPASAIGALAGDAVPDLLAFSLDFATPAIFIAFLLPYIRDRASVVVMVVAGLGTVAGNAHLPSGTGPLAAIVAASILGGLLRSPPARH